MVAVLGAGVAVSQAQTTAQTTFTATKGTSASANQTDFSMSSSPTMQSTVGNALFSTSASEDAPLQIASITPQPAPISFQSMMGIGRNGGQYYGGSRYNGMPRYAPGSLGITFYFGGGATVPQGNTANYLTPNFNVQGGFGWRVNGRLSFPVEFDWDQFGATKSALDNQIAIYDYLFDTTELGQLLNANSHIWSFSLEPTYTLFKGDTLGAYIKVGAGFYHKVANFTLPEQGGGMGYGYGYGCFGGCTYNMDYYTSNAPGYDAGIGLTFARHLYAEARYVYIQNQQRPGIVNTAASLATITDTTTNFYPANSDRTKYIPVTVGFRW